MRRARGLALLIPLFFLTSCGSADDNPTAAPTLTVFAATSLQPAFEQLSEAFTATHPELTVAVNFAGSSTLIQQLEAGAPADVLATADEPTMDAAQASGTIDPSSRMLFAANHLVGIVPAGNPARVTSLQEATADDVKLVACAPQVPCGALALQVAQAAQNQLQPVSEEQHVADVLGKVRSGQADAGLVYTTTATAAADSVEVFELTGAELLQNHYPIARTTDSAHPEAAAEFIEFITSETAQEILSDHGFAAP